MNLPCDNHSDTVAVVLMTNLETGDTLTLCAECQVEWCALVVGLVREPENLEEIHPPAAEEVADLEPVAPVPDAEPKSEPEPAPPPAPKAKRRTAPAQEAPPPGQ